MANSSPEGIELGKGSKLESLSLSINKEKVLEIKKQERSYSEEDMQSLIKIRNYFGENGKTFFEHFAYSFLDRIIEQFKNK